MEAASDLPLVGTVLQIFIVNLLLSGDNAVFITLVSHSMPRHLRRPAFLIGTVFAVLVRIAVTACAAFLLQVPALKLAGAVILVVIAIDMATGAERQLVGLRAGPGGATRRAYGLRRAVAVIVLADLILSFDNMMAIAAQVLNAFLMPLVIGLLVALAVKVLPEPVRLRGWYLWLVAGVTAVVSALGVFGGIQGL